MCEAGDDLFIGVGNVYYFTANLDAIYADRDLGVKNCVRQGIINENLDPSRLYVQLPNQPG